MAGPLSSQPTKGGPIAGSTLQGVFFDIPGFRVGHLTRALNPDKIVRPLLIEQTELGSGACMGCREVVQLRGIGIHHPMKENNEFPT